MHRRLPERTKDKSTVKKAMSHVKLLLNQNNSLHDHEIHSLLIKLDEAAEKIDFLHSQEGLGIYISPQTTRLIDFPFQVTEKVKIGTEFDSRDLLYLAWTRINYCLVSISRKHMRLYAGKGQELKEVVNEDFPRNYIETYEYSKPSRANSFGSNELKDFEKDKSDLQEIRVTDFLRAGDHLLQKYISRETALVLAGGKKELADYLEVTRFKKNIIGKVTGNYDFDGALQLVEQTRIQVSQHLANQKKSLLTAIPELLGKKLLVFGIKDVWKEAHLGKGLTLIVEKDLEKAAFIATQGTDLRFRRPSNKNKYMLVEDAIERTIKTVREKGGQVKFTDNGELQEFGGIVLQLRYNNIPLS